MKQSTINSTTAAVAVGLLAGALALGLTACDDSPRATATAATVESPVPVEQVPAPVEEAPVPVAGEVITAEQADTLPADMGAYTMADGSIVAVSKTGEVPAAVLADAAVPAIAARVAQTDPNAFHAVYDAAQGAGNRISAATGKYVIVVYTFTDIYGQGFQASGGAMVKPLPRSKAPALASAQAYVAAQADPTKWAILDVTGE